MLKGVLTHLVLRGLLTKAEVTALLQETETLLQEHHPEAVNELHAIEQDTPQFLRVPSVPARIRTTTTTNDQTFQGAT